MLLQYLLYFERSFCVSSCSHCRNAEVLKVLSYINDHWHWFSLLRFPKFPRFPGFPRLRFITIPIPYAHSNESPFTMSFLFFGFTQEPENQPMTTIHTAKRDSKWVFCFVIHSRARELAHAEKIILQKEIHDEFSPFWFSQEPENQLTTTIHTANRGDTEVVWSL